jgi:hypothetical protein
MGRPQYHRTYRIDHRMGHRMGRSRSPLGPLLLLLAVALVAGSAMLAMMVMVILPLILVTGAVAFSVTRRRRLRHLGDAHWQHRGLAPHGHPVPRAPRAPRLSSSAAPLAAPDWASAKAGFAQLRSEYAQFECDPLAVLRLPALTDVTVPSTGRFVDAFAEAQALDADQRPPQEHCAKFATAVDQAWRAWRAALDAAERIRLAGIPAEERATVQRAIKLLTVARDSDHDAERSAAYARARAELAKLERTGSLRLPPTAAAALDAAARGQLPPAADATAG